MNGRILVVAVGAAILAACGGAEPSSGALWCDGLCSAVQRCGYQDPTCRPDCVRQRPGLASMSVSGAAAQEPCLAALSCQAIGGDDMAWANELDACWQQAKLSVEITAPVRTFCASQDLALFDCGYTLSLEECERDYAMWKDDVLDRVAVCRTRPTCDAFQACEQATFDNL